LLLGVCYGPMAVGELPTVGDWLAVLDRVYPPSWAEGWDSTGLQVGDQSWEVSRVLVALDPTAEVVAEARERGCGLLITHHPLLFRPLARLDLSEPVTRAAADAISFRVAVAACHTNADVAQPGVSDALAEALGVEVTGVLHQTSAGERVKLVTFVPAEATVKVLDAMAGAGAGVIGEYTHCSFRVRGTGTFIPSERAHPAVGERGDFNEVEEHRLEIVVPKELLSSAVEALLDAHPYEEPAYDVYELASPGGLGLGRIGHLPAHLSAKDLAGRCRERLHSSVRLAGDPDTQVQNVALCGGSGASLLPDALRAGVDAYITGDLKHHQALDAASAGLAVIDAGHHGTEWPFVPLLAAQLSAAAKDLGGKVLVSDTRTDPFAMS
jgi:dinuclear metal center YbgI/SA1388 family protein